METANPTCYRHPGRRAGVRCQRCGREICPDCMHQASVGFHCPECTHAGAEKVVRARNLRSSATHMVTNALIAINVAVFIYGIGPGLNTRDAVITKGGLIGDAFDGRHMVGVGAGEWWRIFSAGFLHANLIHVGLNMWALYILGQMMEPVLGRLKFGLVYGVALVAGSLGVLLLDPNQLTVGASGAVFGLMGAAVAVMRSRGINPFATGLGGMILLNLLITFAVPGISIGGHLGGLAGGFIATWILEDLGPRWRNERAAIAAVSVMGLAIIGACLAVAG